VFLWENDFWKKRAIRLNSEFEQRRILRPRLSLRQTQVCDLVCLGRLEKQIAEALKISPWTVKHHKIAARRKYGVATTAELVAAHTIAKRPPTHTS
jgi:DNA-binding CsgD family transcriptional regulator